MKLIYLKDGSYVKVDDADYAWLSQFKWYAKSSAYKIYPCRSAWINCHSQTIRMDREIMQCPEGMEVDHIDNDTFNAQRVNLEIVTKHENIFRDQLPLFRPDNHNDLTHSK